MHLSEIVRRQAAARPGDPSYSCAETDLTWRQTDERTSRLAAALYARGLRHGDRVAILARACHRYWEVHFGCAKAGLVVVPVNHRLQAAEVKHILSDVGAKAAVVDARLADVAAGADIPLRLGFGLSHGQPLDYEAMLAEHEPVPPAVELDERGPTSSPTRAALPGPRRAPCSAIADRCFPLTDTGWPTGSAATTWC